LGTKAGSGAKILSSPPPENHRIRRTRKYSEIPYMLNLLPYFTIKLLKYYSTTKYRMLWVYILYINKKISWLG
jgi:hypothetical protein